MPAIEATSWKMADATELSRGAQRSAETPDHGTLDEAAFERLHARTSQSLWAYLRRVAGDPATADDVLQESYLKILAHPCPVTGERQENAYLFRIASNLLRDRWRRERRHRGWLESMFAGGAAPGPAPRDTAGWPDPRTASPGEAGRLGEKLDVEAVLGELEPQPRALLWLAYVEGYRHREIAEILGLKAASIRVLLFRARRRLAALLEERGLGPESTQREVNR